MPRLTYQAKMIIQDNKKCSLSELVDLVQIKTGTKYSRQGIANYKNSLPLQTNLTQVDKLDILSKKLDTPKPSRPSRTKKVDLSVNALKQLLDTNPNHYWHDYLEEQFVGKNGKAGKLRSDFQKLCEFLRDVT